MRKQDALFGLGVCCALLVIAVGHVENMTIVFYDGLFALAVVLCIGKMRFRNSAFFQLSANTLILLIAGLVGLELALWPGRTNALALPEENKILAARRSFSFEAAQADPRRFEAWWYHFLREWSGLKGDLERVDPKKRRPFLLEPRSTARFFDSVIAVNSLGFRDREFEKRKRDRYRIVVMGGSTTMGVTMAKSDRPWPSLLQNKIRQRLGLSRVQVINAGVYAYTLEDNIHRLREDVLDIQPDLIISYHGYNGFRFFDAQLAPIRGRRPPAFVDRPAQALARLEFGWKVRQYRNSYFDFSVPLLSFERARGTVLESPYAQLYREFLGEAHDHGIPVVLLSFNMAVNRQSSAEVIRFYAGGFPQVMSSIEANLLHTDLLRRLAESEPGVSYIDTGAGLDGIHTHYIDLVHFTQSGREQLAENVYNGLAPILARDERLAQ